MRKLSKKQVPVRKDWDAFMDDMRAIYQNCKDTKWFDKQAFIDKMTSLKISKERYERTGLLPKDDYERSMIRYYFIQDIPKLWISEKHTHEKME